MDHKKIWENIKYQSLSKIIKGGKSVLMSNAFDDTPHKKCSIKRK